MRAGGRKGGGREEVSAARSVNVSYGIVNLASDFLCFPLFSLEKTTRSSAEVTAD